MIKSIGEVDTEATIHLASISRLSPSKRTNCSVTFDPPVRKGGRGPGRSHHVMLAARDVASCSAC